MKTSNAIHALASIVLIGGMFVLGTVTPPLIPGTAALICGDGVLDEGEHCDDGNTDDSDNCSANCLYTFCGDTLTQRPNANGENEECDDGNTIKGDGCSPVCTFEDCGNGIVQSELYEECDDGLSNSDTEPNACRKNCTLPRCGDSIVDEGETCDDGNTEDDDSCPSACVSVEVVEEEEIPEEPAVVTPEEEELKPAAEEEPGSVTDSAAASAEGEKDEEPTIETVEEEILKNLSQEEAVRETTKVIEAFITESPDIHIVPKSFSAALSALESNDLEGAREAITQTLEEDPVVAATLQSIEEDPDEGQVVALSVVRLVEENILCLLSEDPDGCTRLLSASLEEKEEEGAARRKKKKPAVGEAEETEETEETEEEEEPVELLTNAQLTVALTKTVAGAAGAAGAEYWDTEHQTATLARRIEARLAARIAKEAGTSEEEVTKTFTEAAETGDLSSVRQLLRNAGVRTLSETEERATFEQLTKREEELSATLELASRADPSAVVSPQEALANVGLVENLTLPLQGSIRDLEDLALRQSFEDRLQLLSARIPGTDTEEELATLIAGLQALAGDVSTALTAQWQDKTFFQYVIQRVSSFLTPEVEAADVSLAASLLGGKTVVIGNLSTWVITLGGLALVITLPGLHRRRDRRANRRFLNIATGTPVHQ